MHWGEICIADEKQQLTATLEYLNEDDPDHGWHIAPFFARSETAPPETAKVPAQPPASEAMGKRVYFDRVVAELNLDVRDTFTLLLANACALLDQRDALKAELAALRADGGTAKAPDGWKLVPVEPTPEMMAAWTAETVKQVFGCYQQASHGERGREDARFTAYRAMLAAAPSPNGDEVKG